MDKRIKELAAQAGMARHEYIYIGNEYHIARFAELVRQDEREANAKLADDFERKEYEAIGDPRAPAFKSLIGEAIRARGKHD